MVQSSPTQKVQTHVTRWYIRRGGTARSFRYYPRCGFTPSLTSGRCRSRRGRRPGMSDFMKSPFVAACQNSLDQDAINAERLGRLLEQDVADPRLWPEDLRLWTAELLERSEERRGG